MIRRLLAGYLAVTAVVLIVLGAPLALLYARHERAKLVEEVRIDAVETATYAALPLAGHQVGNAAGDSAGDLQGIADRYGKATDGRMIIVDATGRVVADSEAAIGRSFASRPEVSSALRGQESHGFRYSNTLGHDLFYVATPVNSGGEIFGAVRITYPASFVDDRIHRSWVVLAVVALAAVVLVGAMSFAVARSVARPVRALDDAATKFGEGDLTARSTVPSGPPELRHLARSFNETAAKVERLVVAQQAFVADASHQLRTPLAALRLRLENVEASGAVAGGAADDIHGALDEVHRLGRLVEGLLTLARADSSAIAPVAVDIDGVVASRVGSWAPFAEEAGVALAVDGEAGAALVTPDAVEQVLDNLLANAIEATPEGARVTVGLRRQDDEIHVHVIDEGPGMSEAERAQAFTRFLSGRPRSMAGGFGLGLAIASRLVQRDGGELRLEEAATGGVDAHVQLRAAPEPARRPSHSPAGLSRS